MTRRRSHPITVGAAAWAALGTAATIVVPGTEAAAVRPVSGPAMWLFDAYPMHGLGNSPAIWVISLT